MGNYHQLGEALSEAGLVAFGHDHEGHGLSGGERVNIQDFQLFVDDVFRDCKIMKREQQNKELPIFVFGHSMGGLITLLSVLQRPGYFRGMVLSGPLIQNDDTHGNLNFINRRIGDIANMFMPNFQAGNRIENKENSQDLEMINKLDNDPLVWKDRFKAQMAVATFQAVDTINEKLDLLTIPFLVMHGAEDTIVWPSGSRELYSRAKAHDKQILILPGRKHHLILDFGREQVVQTVLNWILQRI